MNSHSKELALKRVDELIRAVEKQCDSGESTPHFLARHKQMAQAIMAEYAHDESFGPDDVGLFKPFELQALIALAEGKNNEATSWMEEAKTWMRANEKFVSRAGRKWDEEQTQTNIHPQATAKTHKKFNGKFEGWLALWTVGMILTPLIWVWNFIDLNSFQNEVNSAGTSDIFGSYISTSRILLGVALTILAILAVPYFSKSRATRKVAVTYCALIFIFGVIQYSLWDSALQKVGSTVDEAGTTGSMFNALVLPWFFYWIFSKRVKETFTK